MTSTRLSIKVIPNSRVEKVTKEGERLKVYVRAPALDGKANAAAVELLAEFLGVKRSALRIVRGERSREKVIEMENFPAHD